MEEREAIARLKRGDIGGLEVLVRKHGDRAQRAAYLIVRDRELAEDVVQGAFLRAYEKIGRFDEELPFGPWFLKTVANTAVRVAVRNERIVRPSDGSEYLMATLRDPEAGPQELAEQAETRRKVWAALGRLPPTQRAVVVQRYFLGMSEAEMATSGRVPSGTIKSRLSAARCKLTGLLRSQFRSGGAEPFTALSGVAERSNND